jgi:hypothetical protein
MPPVLDLEDGPVAVPEDALLPPEFVGVAVAGVVVEVAVGLPVVSAVPDSFSNPSFTVTGKM